MHLLKIRILMLSIVLISFCYAQNETYSLTIKVNSPAVADSGQVFVAGNQPLLGNWHPAKAALEKQVDNIWQQTFSFPKDTQLAFKITRGTWDSEALNEDESVPGNYHVTLSQDTVFSITVLKWKDSGLGKKPLAGQITGTVRYHKKMAGEGIQPRDVIVWLPPGYETDKKKRYPVLYMHDGQNIIDPATSFLGTDWQADEVADSLIRAEKIAPMIIVGAYNTSDRSAEYSDTTLGHAYMNFLVHELKPFIDETYRTLPEREHTATMGSSMGGLISFLLVWYHPDVFSQAGCLSPAFIYKYHNAVTMVENYTGADKNIRIYMDNGGLDLEAVLQPGCDNMLAALKKLGFREGENLQWFLDPEAAHTESAWAKRLWRPLTFLYGKASH